METQKTEKQTVVETENGNEKQCFLTTQLRFNLRQRADQNKPTIIYVVLRFNGKKHSINSGVKVLPSQWSKKRQQAIISSEYCNLDNHNNRIANGKLNSIREKFAIAEKNFKENFCVQDNNSILALLKVTSFNMKKNKNNFTTELSKLNIEDSVSDNTKTAREQALQIFKNFIKTNKFEDSQNAVNYKNWELFKKYLLDIKQGNGKHYTQRTIELYLQNIKRLFQMFNDSREDTVISIDSLRPLKVHNILNSEQKQSKNIIITENEIEQLYKEKLSDCKQQTAKDLFLFQCSIGCRISDLQKIVRGDFDLKDFDGITFINYQSKKTNTDTYTPLFTDTARELFSWVQTLKKFPFSTVEYNKQIKQAFKAMGQNETVKITENRGGKIVVSEKKKWELIHNHDARHSFITNMYYKGIPSDRLKLMSGHANTKLIDTVYKQLDKGKELALISKAYKPVKPQQAEKEQATAHAYTREELKRLAQETDDIKQQRMIATLSSGFVVLP